MDTHYETLGVSRGASASIIRIAYEGKLKALARAALPDAERRAEERRLADAFDTLSQPAKRQKYDDELEAREARSSASEGRRGTLVAVVTAAVVVLAVGGYFVDRSRTRERLRLEADNVRLEQQRLAEERERSEKAAQLERARLERITESERARLEAASQPPAERAGEAPRDAAAADDEARRRGEARAYAEIMERHEAARKEQEARAARREQEAEERRAEERERERALAEVERQKQFVRDRELEEKSLREERHDRVRAEEKERERRRAREEAQRLEEERRRREEDNRRTYIRIIR